MSVLRWVIGDTRKALPTLDPGSVDLVLTSPPFLALRSYLPADHPDKASEIGSEPTPGEFVDALLDVVEACERVLAPHGTMCFELGDTYCGARGYGTEGTNPLYGERADERLREARVERRFKKPDDGWPEAKSLCLIPESFWALVYGRNPFNGRETPRWRARNVIRWVRPNPPVGALGDKFRPATSEMVVLCKARDRWFDLDAVRERNARTDETFAVTERRLGRDVPNGGAETKELTDRIALNPAGAPPLDWWEIPTQGYPGAHYATWPKALLQRPIKAMCPEWVCVTCGEPSRRIVDAQRTLDGVAADLPPLSRTERAGAEADGIGHWRKGTTYTTLGWTDCGHDTWRPGVVLDPFAGSGTTLDVAHGLGRSAIGIDLDPRNVLLAQDRLGMFPLDVTDVRTWTLAEAQEALP